MRTPTSIAGHPLHPMLVTLPIGLWVFSLVCDVILVTGHNPDLWFTVAYVTMAGGVAGAVLAGLVGAVDLAALPRGHARAVAWAHMTLNLVVTALYLLNLWLRTGPLESMVMPLLLSLTAVIILGISGWLGGELVHVHLVGVDTDEPARRAGRRAGTALRPDRPRDTRSRA